MVKINQKGANRIRSGHLWVFQGDVQSAQGAHGGEIVSVVDSKGHFLAKAFYSARSRIALRVLTREDISIDDDFWRKRITNAFALREKVVINSNAYRVVYADSDLLSSIIIDRFGDYFVLQTLSQGAESIKDQLAGLLIDLFQPKGIVERNDSKVRELEGLTLTSRVIYGHVPESVEVFEGNVTFRVDIRTGQKTGFFLDQRENRLVAATYAKGRALDCFSYSGAFALQLAQRAEHVVAIDISSQAVEQGKKNAELNGLSNLEFREGNCFDLLHDFDDQKARFDTIVLDPPAFAKSKKAVGAAIRGYKEINLRAMKLLNTGSILVTCSCSYHLSEGEFWLMLNDAAADAHRSLQIIEKRTQARDHPILLSVPESYYLKCFILRVI